MNSLQQIIACLEMARSYTRMIHTIYMSIQIPFSGAQKTVLTNYWSASQLNEGTTTYLGRLHKHLFQCLLGIKVHSGKGPAFFKLQGFYTYCIESVEILTLC